MMRIRGFLLVEAIIFVFVMILSFVAISKVMMSYSSIFVIDRHHHMLTTSCSPGYPDSFKRYCKKNNIKIIKEDLCKYDIDINGKMYTVGMNSDEDGYDFLSI